jgi:hypothetical protein
MMSSSPETEISLPVLERWIRTSVKLGKKISEKILNQNLVGNQLLQMALIVVKIEKTSNSVEKTSKLNENTSKPVEIPSKPNEKTSTQDLNTVDLTSKILSKALFDYNEKVNSV